MNTPAILGIWLYEKKIREKNESAAERYKGILMQMDWTARCFTGQDTGLLKKFEEQTKTPAAAAEKTLDERVKEEETLLGKFNKIGIKVKEN